MTRGNEMEEQTGIAEEPILSVYTDLLEAWNRQDADTFAGLFTSTGSVVGFDGSPMNGRDEIAAELRAIFANHPTAKYIARVREVRRISSHVILLRAVVGMIPPGKSELNPAVNAVQSLVMLHERDGAKIALLHNTPAAFHGRPHLSEHLTQELAQVVRSGQTVDAG